MAQAQPVHIPSDPLEKPSGKLPRFTSSQASVYLDAVRGAAAVLVLLGHLRFLFFQDLSLLPAHRAVATVPYMLLGAGHQAVMVFFVLSGYLISGSIFRMLDTDQWSWKRYLTHRVVRLWVVLIPVLLVCIPWDWVGLHLHNPGAILLYGGQVKNHIVNEAVGPRFRPAPWFGTLFFLHGTFTTAFGSDGALWSLANEFWYYILFPCVWLTFARRTPAAQRVLYVALIALICAFLQRDILKLFPVWLLGTWMAKLPAPDFNRHIRLLATIAWLPTIIVALALDRKGYSLLSDYAFGLVTMGFLWVLLSARMAARKESLRVRSSRLLARFSYTLYAAHTPPMLLAAALLVGANRWNLDLQHVAIATGLAVALLLYGLALASVTEFRTDSVRKWVEQRLGVPNPN